MSNSTVRVCETCGKPFQSRARLRPGEGRFCSKPCAHANWRQKALSVESIGRRFREQLITDGPVLVPDLGPCHTWRGVRDRFGYARMSICGRGYQGSWVAWLLSHGRWPEPCALHKCDGGSIGCVRIEHLFEGTKADNTSDMCAKGRARGRAPGSPGRARKLDADKVRWIRLELLRGASKYSIAKALAVDPKTIDMVASGRTWAHVL